jgi:cytochrome c oxidase assembly protein subunit 15
VTQQEISIPAARASQDAAGGRLGTLRRWSPTPKQVEWACFAALLANTLIVITGGAVRLTNSGLG